MNGRVVKAVGEVVPIAPGGAPSRVYLTANQVRARYGGISDMTLWRWLHDPDMHFPQPTVINNRRYFEDGKLAEFDRRKAAKNVEAA